MLSWPTTPAPSGGYQKLNTLGVWGLNGGLDREVIEFSSKTFADLGMIKRRVTYEELVDPSVVAGVIGELGRF